MIKEQMKMWKIKCLLKLYSAAASLLERACPDFSGRKRGEVKPAKNLDTFIGQRFFMIYKYFSNKEHCNEKLISNHPWQAPMSLP